MAEAPGTGSAGGQQETRDGPHLRPSFLLSERPPIASGDGKDAGCQADTPPGSGQQVFRRSASRRGSDRAGLLLGQHPGSRPSSSQRSPRAHHGSLPPDTRSTPGRRRPGPPARSASPACSSRGHLSRCGWPASTVRHFDPAPYPSGPTRSSRPSAEWSVAGRSNRLRHQGSGLLVQNDRVRDPAIWGTPVRRSAVSV